MSLLFDVPDKLQLQIICNTLAASSVPQAPCALYATCLDSRLAPRCHHNPLCAYHIAQIWASARVPTARFPGEGPGLFVNFETLAQLDAVHANCKGMQRLCPHESLNGAGARQGPAKKPKQDSAVCQPRGSTTRTNLDLPMVCIISLVDFGQ